MKQDKTKSIFGLRKIPDNDLLRHANIEIGKLKSYIDELIYERCILKNELFNLRKLTPEECQAARKEYLQSQLGIRLNAEIADLRCELKHLKKEYETLLNRYLVLKGD